MNNVNLEVNPEGLSFQAMDLSHVALVTLKLNSEGFQDYRAQSTLSLGLKLQNLHKFLRCAGNDDSITLEAQENPETLSLKFESQKEDKVSKFNLNLMLQEDEQLQIP